MMIKMLLMFLPDQNAALKLYFAYCTILASFVIYQGIIVKHTLAVTETTKFLDKDYPINHLSICGRNLTLLSTPSSSHDTNAQKETSKVKKRLVIIGHDKMNHVQLNNKLNAIFHATDYAKDINADLAIIRQGWPTKSLKLLFQGNSFSSQDKANNNDEDDSRLTWENEITKHLNIYFLDKDEIHQHDHIATHLYEEVAYLSSDDMYYYHTKASVETIKQRRQSMLSFLWSHPTRNHEEYGKDVCSLVNHYGKIGMNDFSSYAVVHVRWMKNNGCLNRMGGLAHHLKNSRNMYMDRKVPCLLHPSYIESIVRTKCKNMSDKPIYIISDGLNETIIEKLQKDGHIGGQIRLPPKNISWVGGDMMLGVLSDCFIGTPISTLSGNIARARIAIGKHPSTNFLFPRKRLKETDPWDFYCQEDANCLYDVGILNHYVG